MTAPRSEPGTILIVDDVVENLQMLTDMLQLQGHTVCIAQSGQEALDVVQDTTPDLILLDIQMPEMNGYQVCEAIKADETTRNIPVIFLSALSETDDILKGFEVGGVDYVSKPFQFREVLARVNSQLAVSQQRRKIDELHESERQQFAALAAVKDRFLHATAHDLKNPLTGMVLYTQMLRSAEIDDAQELAEIAAGIEASARKMQRLVTDILDLAQAQIGNQMTLIEQPIQPLIENSLKNLRVIAEDKGLTLTADIPSEPLHLSVDQHYFERVLDNLISNAIKYTDAGGSITLTVTTSGQCASFAVTDTGIGIPEADQARLFEAFYRVKDTQHRKQSGTGLGLSIVAAIVEQHHGTVTLESEPGVGTTFTVNLPIA